MQPLADAAGVSIDDFEATSEWLWEFSVGNDAENYPFTALPEDHMGGRSAGWALGRNAAHVYVGAGKHLLRCTLVRAGRSWLGERTIEIVERAYAPDQTAVLDPAGEWTLDSIPAHDAANRFTAIDDAFLWFGAADNRALHIRRGTRHTLTVSGTTIRANALIAAYGSGERPFIVADFGYRTARIAATGDGTSRVFEGASLGTNIYVYFDNALQTEGAAYVRAGNRITAAPGPGVTLRVFNQGSNGTLAFGGMVLAMGGGRDGGIVRDIRLEGQYDAANPGYFDRTDLSTANRFAGTTGIGGSSGTQNAITIFNCDINRFGYNVTSTNPGEMLAVVNCNLDEWANYGFYSSNIARTIAVGCSIVQNRMAQNSAQAKALNTPVQISGSPLASLNAPWHGPMRCAYSFEQVLNSCRMDSRTSWAGNEPIRAQPVTRLAQSTKPGQNYTYTQCHTSGGQGCFSGGAANETVTANRLGMAHVGYNVFVSYPCKESFGNGQIYVTSISNLYLIPAGTGATGDFALFRKQTEGPYIVAEDVRQEAWRSINDTVLVLDSRTRTLDLNPTYVLASAGMQNLYSVTADFAVGTAKTSRPPFGGYAVPAAAVGTATVRVPINAQSLSAKSTFATRIWRGRTLAEATSAATVTAQRALYRWQYHNHPLGEDGATTIRDAEWLEVTLTSGTWAAGDMVWITREQGVETAGTLEIDEETGEETGTVVTSLPETFSPNNRLVPLVRPPAAFHNSLILIPGSWGTVKRDEVPVSDLAPYRPATWGPFDAWWRPDPSNAAAGKAEGLHAAFDLRGRRRSGRSIGALEPDSDVTGWPPLPEVPVVSIRLDPPVYVEGDSVGQQNVAVTVSSPGQPALAASDVATWVEVLEADNSPVPRAATHVLKAGQKLRGQAAWAHPTVPRVSLATPQVTVAGLNFAPVWIDSDPDATNLGARAKVVGLGTLHDARNQHIAFRIRNRHLAAIAARLYQASGATGTPRLALSNSGVLQALEVGSSSVVLATVPNTGGTCSVLLSSYLEGNGPGGAGLRAWVKVGSGPVTEVAIAGAAKRIVGSGYNLFVTTQGTADLDFQQYFGVWYGGLPAFADVFQPDGSVRQWSANPGLGVTGMASLSLLNGVGAPGVPGTFNGHPDDTLPPPRLWLAGAP